MSKDQLDEFEPKEQSKSSSSKAAATVPIAASAPATRTTAPATETQFPALMARLPKFHVTIPRFSPRSFGSAHGRGSQGTGFLVAFAAGSLGVLFLFAVMAAAFGGSNKTVSGVHVGSVDVSGLSRDQVVEKLQASYAYLSQGQINVSTPVGSDTIRFAEAGRAPDVEVMADSAMSIGHSGNPLSDAITTVHTAILGETVPVVVKVDPAVLAQRVHSLVGAGEVESRNAEVSTKTGTFTFTPAQTGRGIDEGSLATAIIDQLVLPAPAASVQSNATFVDLPPQLNDTMVQQAIAKAKKMVVDVNLQWITRTWTIPAGTIKSWITFGWQPDGNYGPALDPALSGAYLAKLTSSANILAVEPSVVWDAAGNPVNLTAGKDGLGVDTAATTLAISNYLSALAGGGTASNVQVVTSAILPRINDVGTVTGMSIIGSWTTVFFPGESNGGGANIRQPAKVLNGTVIGPGQQFSFLGSVGPIDEAHGFAKGGVILSGVSDHTGAMGGGICSASTTVFNAAIKAGLQIDERHAHAYYVSRYPAGLDATVFSNGTSVYDMKFTNDTPNAIVLRTWATYFYGQNYITAQLWSLPLGRTVDLSDGVKAMTHIATASDTTRFVSSIAPGKTYRAEYPTNGFDTTVTRVVKDKNGTVIHTNTWLSHYIRVDGLLQIGTTPNPSGSPSKVPTPTPGAPTPTPVPSATPTPRRRRHP